MIYVLYGVIDSINIMNNLITGRGPACCWVCGSLHRPTRSGTSRRCCPFYNNWTRSRRSHFWGCRMFWGGMQCSCPARSSRSLPCTHTAWCRGCTAGWPATHRSSRFWSSRPGWTRPGTHTPRSSSWATRRTGIPSGRCWRLCCGWSRACSCTLATPMAALSAPRSLCICFGSVCISHSGLMRKGVNTGIGYFSFMSNFPSTCRRHWPVSSQVHKLSSRTHWVPCKSYRWDYTGYTF